MMIMLAAFAAGYIDAVAGGGGMIQTLALLMVGIPPVQTLATNKIVSLSGTMTAVAKYAKARSVNWYLVFACLIPCMAAAAVGSWTIMFFSDEVIVWIIIICIPVAFSVMFIKQRQQTSSGESTSRVRAIALMTPIAFYDGLVGPGTGTYMAIAGNKGLHMNFLRATGLAKPLNLSTNIGSAIVYAFKGQVLWGIAIPMAAASILGAYLGSHSAIKYGDDFIKKVMLIMLVVMLIANIVKLF